LTLGSIFESGAVYYPRILGIPIVIGAILGGRRVSRRALWILAAAILAFVLFDFAFDETRFEDIPFFVVLGVFMFLLGLLARFVAGRLRPRLG
jgi:RsiW-degrading membrane proteinase PrsW (M82 family)